MFPRQRLSDRNTCIRYKLYALSDVDICSHASNDHRCRLVMNLSMRLSLAAKLPKCSCDPSACTLALCQCTTRSQDDWSPANLASLVPQASICRLGATSKAPALARHSRDMSPDSPRTGGAGGRRWYAHMRGRRRQPHRPSTGSSSATLRTSERRRITACLSRHAACAAW